MHVLWVRTEIFKILLFFYEMVNLVRIFLHIGSQMRPIAWYALYVDVRMLLSIPCRTSLYPLFAATQLNKFRG